MGCQAKFAAETYVGKNKFSPFTVLEGFKDITARAIAIQLPIALASFLETIENVEAAELGGDSYNVHEAMLCDGLGTMFGAICGATIPTTVRREDHRSGARRDERLFTPAPVEQVYIGHRRHKASGATAGYSLCNGLAYFVLMMSGLTGLFFYLIDGVSIGVILIAVGLMIVQQALEVSPSRHYPCLMVGIMFVVADMIYFDHFNAGVGMATRSLGRMRGVSNMAPAGGIMCSLIVSWILCDLTDSNFVRGGVVAALASFLSLFGLMHGNNYVFSDGTVMSADTGGDHYTTDLGEVVLSTFTEPKVGRAPPSLRAPPSEEEC
jgi:AGZA family xanthine/uracil permease-like MFS transporter